MAQAGDESTSPAQGQRGVLRAGLIGHAIRHSWSPVMQTAAFTALHVTASYELWGTEPARLADRIAGLRRPDMLGANVTIPYKTSVLPFLDACADEVGHALGAVNTIVREETSTGVRLVGYNTDVLALRRLLRDVPAWSRGKRLLLVGAGGAARAILAVALEQGLEPWIAVRRPDAGRNMLSEFLGQGLSSESGTQLHSWMIEHVIDLADVGSLAAHLSHTDVLVQSTPVGTESPSESPVPLSLIKQLPPHAFVFDLVYNPPVTALVHGALAHGLQASGGLPMLLHQGALAFSLWTGLAAPLDRMRQALEQQIVSSPATE